MNNSHNSCGLCRIDIKNLTVKSGNDTLIENINISFNCGELAALLGKNGAGKTTLLKAILGERNYTGEIIFQSHNGAISQKPIIGYVPQQLIFDKNTPISVLDFMCAASYKRPVWFGQNKKIKTQIEERLKFLNCADIAQRELGNLSGGELQRVLLLMATDPIPDMLILDEPVSGVDVNGLDIFYKMVSDLRDNYHMSILIVSHDLNLIKQYADKVVLIDKTIIAEGSTNKVFESDIFKSSFMSFS